MPEWIRVFNKSEKESEVLLYGSIGDDFWDEKAVSFAKFRKEWNTIPAGNKVAVRINSNGGAVWDGIPIYNLIAERRADVTCHVEGVAASIASVIALAGSRLVMPKQAEIFIHDPWAGAAGDAAVMQNMADRLNFIGDQIADIYAAKCGKSREEMRGMMKANGLGTSFLGQAAKEFGLVDEITDAEPMKNSFDLSRFRLVPAAIGGVLPPPSDKTKTKGSPMETTPKTAQTAEVTPTPTVPTPVSNVIDVAEFNRLKAELATTQNAVEASRRETMKLKLNALAAERDLDPTDWIEHAMRDDSVLVKLAKLPARGAKPVGSTPITVSDTEPNEPKNEREAGESFVRLTNPLARAQFYKAHREKVRASVFNHSRQFTSPQAANVFTTLTHTVLAQRAMEAFIYTLQPLTAFSTNFSADAAKNGDKVKVLFTAAADSAYDWAGSYVVQDVDAEGKDITIDKRKVVSWGLTTEEIMEQPQIAMDTFAIQKGNKLGLAMVQDIFSLITEANYGAGAISSTASGGDQLVVTAANFDLDEISWLYAACSLANWPQMPRSMVLSIPYYAQLFRESEVVGTEGLASSNPRMLAEAEIRRLMGFDIYETNAISGTATDNVTGFCANPDGILIANRVVIPDQGIANRPAVNVLTDPATGVSIVQREWFNPDNDQSIRVLEVAYGKLVGNTKGIKLISSS